MYTATAGRSSIVSKVASVAALLTCVGENHIVVLPFDDICKRDMGSAFGLKPMVHFLRRRVASSIAKQQAIIFMCADSLDKISQRPAGRE